MKSLFFVSTLLYFINCCAQKNTVKVEYFCAPCGCKNDGKVFDKSGVCTLCGMKLQQVGTFNYEMATVSGDGQLMAYKSSKPDNIGRIFYKEITTAGIDKLIGEGSMPQISPDKNYIVFEGRDNKILLYKIQSDTIVDISPGLPGLQSPAWASSGNLIFAAGEFPQLSIYRMNITNKKFESLTIEQGMRYGCKASPDGKKIAYRCVRRITDSTYKKGLAVYDVLTGEEKYITTIGEYCTWSPNGKQLAFHWKGDKYFAVYIVNADGTGLKKIAEDKNGDSELPVCSADCKQLYFQTNRRHGNREIWTMNANGSNQKPFIW
jgi:Tol biopolymer transport system component